MLSAAGAQADADHSLIFSKTEWWSGGTMLSRASAHGFQKNTARAQVDADQCRTFSNSTDMMHYRGGTVHAFAGTTKCSSKHDLECVLSKKCSLHRGHCASETDRSVRWMHSATSLPMCFDDGTSMASALSRSLLSKIEDLLIEKV